MITTDLIIIGAGPAGYKAAEYAAKNNLKVIVFEANKLGGTCLNVGCIPTKAFAKNAQILDDLKKANVFGIDNLHYDFNFNKVLERKHQVVESLRDGIKSLLNHPNISVINSIAEFKDEYSVIAEGQVYKAEHIIIATGSQNKMLPSSMINSSRVVDSTSLLNLTELPDSMCIIGAGVIGMEFASIFNSFGVEVTVVEFLKECLPAIDSDIAKRLRKSLEKRGVKFNMQCAVKAIEDNRVDFENKKGILESVYADKILVAVGRKPVTDGLKLDSLNVQLINGAIPVENNSFRVINKQGGAVKSVFAVGDVNALQMLAHAAEMQAIHAVNVIMGKEDCINLNVMPAAVFTNPEAAAVGYSEDECKDKGVKFVCRKAFWRANGKALAMDETEGMLKLMVNQEGQILGCHAFGAHAADIIQEVSVLMCKQALLHDIADMVHIHPTLSEILRDAVG